MWRTPLLVRLLNRIRNTARMNETTTTTTTATTTSGAAGEGPKASGYNFYRERLGSPRYVVAPMVEGSELAWRILSRYYGAELCYTPMIHAGLFASDKNAKYRQEQFDLAAQEEGHPNLDRPLLLQFCANKPDLLLKASQFITGSDPKTSTPQYPVDGFDLNLGCPQGIAKKGKYGAFLMDHLDLINQLVSNLHLHSPVPVTVKYRRFETVEKTQDYTRRLIGAGAQILTIHGRTREQKGQFTGLADWKIIRAAAETSHGHERPIFGNGNILVSSDILEHMRETGVDGVMSAEGNLYNPAIFAPLNPTFVATFRAQLPERFQAGFALIEREYDDPVFGSPQSLLEFPTSTKVASQYLMICRTLLTRTSTCAIKGHLYKLFRPVFATGGYDDLRNRLAQISWSSTPSSSFTRRPELCSAKESGATIEQTMKKSPKIKNKDRAKIKDRPSYENVLDCFQDVVDLIKVRLEHDRESGLLKEDEMDKNLVRQDGESTVEYLERLKIPYSRCQPYIRPGGQVEGTQQGEPEEEAGLAPCSNPNGCLNSGGVKCKWKMCKKCCGEKTGVGSMSTEELEQLESGREFCETHLKRARLSSSQGRKKICCR